MALKARSTKSDILDPSIKSLRSYEMGTNKHANKGQHSSLLRGMMNKTMVSMKGRPTATKNQVG